ncbi:MAG: hypothetical protein RLN76_02695 [Phycisphaeraceae bacterium]
MRFTLIDRVLESSVERVVAVKAVTAAEEYLGDHFPGYAVLPGVLMVEAMAQAGRVLAAALGLDERMMISGVRNVRFAAVVRPGQVLRVTVTPRKISEGVLACEGRGEVEGALAVSGRFTLAAASAEGVLP